LTVSVVEEVGLTDVGRQRQSNEDSFYESTPVFAVADGMGGARAGEVASRMAVEAFGEPAGRDAGPEARLESIARLANRRIYDLAQDDDAYRGMGTTLTAVIVGGREIAVGHVGDSRLYRLRGGELERLTTDHSLVEEYIRAGRLAPEEAETHPQKSVITRALGVEADVDVDTLTCDACDGDVYLLCSDGLTGMVAESEVADILINRSSLEQAGRALIDAANHAGGRDNITVVLFRVGEAGAPAGDDGDTLSGEDTQTALDARDVREALAAEARDPGGTPARGGGAAAEPRAGETMVVDARMAGRARASAGRDEEHRRQHEGRDRPRPRRAVLGAALALVAVAAVLGGLLVAGRGVYFVGTSDAGLIALYRGLPYELPFDVDLYEEVYETTLPAGSLPEPQRGNVLDHELRSRRDATDLVRDLERGRTTPVAGGGG
jgi:serine/threonine protein phosphatase PrpC